MRFILKHGVSGRPLKGQTGLLIDKVVKQVKEDVKKKNHKTMSQCISLPPPLFDNMTVPCIISDDIILSIS